MLLSCLLSSLVDNPDMEQGRGQGGLDETLKGVPDFTVWWLEGAPPSTHVTSVLTWQMGKSSDVRIRCEALRTVPLLP